MILLRTGAEPAVATESPHITVSVLIHDNAMLLPTSNLNDLLVRDGTHQQGLRVRIECKSVPADEMLPCATVAQLALFRGTHGVYCASDRA